MTSPMEGVLPSDVLDKSIELLETWGWTKGTMLRWDGSMCLAGAICVAGGTIDHRLDETIDHRLDERGRWKIQYLSGASDLAEQTYPYVHAVIGSASVVRFNDEPKRTRKQVIDALKKARDLALSEGR